MHRNTGARTRDLAREPLLGPSERIALMVQLEDACARVPGLEYVVLVQYYNITLLQNSSTTT